MEAVRQGAGPGAVDLLYGCDVQPRGHLAEAARALCGRGAHGLASAQRGTRPHSRGAQRRRHAAGGGRGDLPDGDLRRNARRGRRAGDLRPGSRRARRGVAGGGAGEVGRAALVVVVEVAGAGGQIVLEYYRGGFEVASKAVATPVTQAGRGGERAVVEILSRPFGDCGVVGEEFGG